MEEERHDRYEKIVDLIDGLNNRMYAYGEGDEEILDSLMMKLVGKIPCVWMHKDGNRQQCYANMYSKLLLAYLISEIKSGVLQGMSLLECMKEEQLDYWEDFFFDDMGYATAAALEKIVVENITCQSIFEMKSDYIDLSEYDSKDAYDVGKEKIRECIIDAVPLLSKCMDPDDDEIDFDSIRCFRSNFYNFEVEVETISSQIVYEIWKREQQCPTEQGKWLLDENMHVFAALMQSDYLNNGLSWCLMDEQTQTMYYFLLTCSEVLGNGERYYGEEVYDRVHRYNYRYIYRINKLQELIKDYINKYQL